MLIQFVFDVGFDVLDPVPQAWKTEGPQVDAFRKGLPETAPRRFTLQVLVGAADQLKMAGDSPVCPERE